MFRKVLLTGDRPTGKLHLGHYVGSLKSRIELQEEMETFIMIADAQAITDNVKDINKVKTNILEVACDYLAVGIDPSKSHIFIQSLIPEIPELTSYFLNLTTINRIGQNPTVKNEIKMRKFKEGVPAGFYLYPIFQVADITAFKANCVPVGVDQAPMVELARDMARKFNDTYHREVLTIPEALFPAEEITLPGSDGQKMSKSLGNAINLSSEVDEIKKRVSKMRSDPNRIHLEDPGDPEKAIAFTYLDIFDPEPEKVEELKDHYRRGGLPDKVVKERLLEVLEAFIAPIRKRRREYSENPDAVFKILRKGTDFAREKAAATLKEVKAAMGIDYHF